jgi:pyrophosphatase PpaX
MADAPGRVSCVIFDMDGTLTQTNELIFASFNHLARKYLGKEFTPAEVVSFFGPPEEGAIACAFGNEPVDRLMDELCDFYREHHQRMARLHPGVEDLLRSLKERGAILAIFTGKGRRTAGITLEMTGVKGFFDLVVSGNDVVNHKPHPEGIMKILATFKLTPGEALMVGDSLSDIRASRAAGVPMAAVVWDSYDRVRVAEASRDCVFDTAEALSGWLLPRIAPGRQAGTFQPSIGSACPMNDAPRGSVADPR